ncbi:hypothetical protein GV794_24480 [Nocardia cyriacigeorgica]|uniref:Uncharacterized protein n=1 Tax=Nocardia cyriacigeorgica TaxID=135487 RepID=A0A6P1DEZ1_9NOCA|nr:hypothetical protein [Nocardia cyriacigeorgica]NEW37382.1 hypothetical protein [Nocardia cyriacigeorgica]NEW47734.1 hypothetical protein [Nocardia cyriacigeorgica]NEW50582.1 hypothetical protein [Nocardia cyriacigeorgica]NEW58770.1 hypothetical protein [Nocardia cyriacigeorgica]
MATTEIDSQAPTSTDSRRDHISVPLHRGRLHRPLLTMVGAMIALTIVSACGVVVDDRTLLDESVWVKPLKFGIAFALYGLTLAYLLALSHRARRATWWLGAMVAISGFLDVGFIAVQAARGTFSHFNNYDNDPVNVIGQQIFAASVPGLFLANLLIALILCWQRLVDRPTTWAIRSGLALAVVGMAQAYLMGFTGTQRVLDAEGRVVELIAGHTVLDPADRTEAARDGAGMPITHWSTIGGDLRIPHFLGLHGIQVLILAVIAAAWLGQRYSWLRSERTRTELVGVLALGYTGLFGLTYWQAMRAQPLLRPDTATVIAVTALLTAVACLTALVYRKARANRSASPTPESTAVSATVRPRGRV